MARPSSIYRSSQTYSSQPIGTTRTRYKFPILDVHELVDCLDTVGFDISEDMFVKPSSSFMRNLVDQIMDKFLFISPRSLRDKINETTEQHSNNFNNDGEDGNNNYIDSESLSNTMNIVAAQRIMHKFLCDCGVDDFSIKDIAKPDPVRVRIILSAVVNFAKFREMRMADCEQLLSESEEIIDKYKQILSIYRTLNENFQTLTKKINESEFTIDEIDEKNKKLEDELRNLRRIHEELNMEHSKYRSEKNGLIKEGDNQSFLVLEAEKELEKIKGYIKESPQTVSQVNEDLMSSLKDEQETLDSLDAKSRKLSISIDSFGLLSQEFRNLSKIIEDIQIEIGKHEAAQSKFYKYEELQEDAQIEVDDLNRKTQQVERQLKISEEKINRINQLSQEKLEQLKEKLDKLRDQYATAMTERDLSDMSLSKKSAQIDLWKNQMKQMQTAFEIECKEANIEMEKLNSHISLYLIDMQKKLS
ncbi:hypothetical protein B5S30_g1979 [[Candida] boidinii]|nr:hypothetical protein B5S30_g1979 [[Candida] boidinii]